MKKISFFLMILYFSIQSYAQNTEVPDVIQPPELTRQYQKYLGYPVSIATGIPEINIPLYNLNVNDYTLPLSLSYHSSGIKVEQVPGTVGYGWSLMPSFRISRTINNKMDTQYLLDSAEIKKEAEIRLGAGGVEFVEEDVKYLNKITAPNTSSVPQHDTQYDIFTIQLPNCSNSFIMQKNNGKFEIVQIKPSPLKITPYYLYPERASEIKAFDVLDENGILYKFGIYDEQVPFAPYTEWSLHDSYATGWMLYKIILPSSEEITFTYTRRDLDVRSGFYNIDIIYDYLSLHRLSGSLSQIIEAGGFQFGQEAQRESTRSHSYPGYDSKNISCLPLTIKSSNADIIFSYEGEKSWNLNEVNIYNKTDAIPVKTISLHREEENLLKSLSVSGEGVYKFDYNSLRFNSKFSQDYWGYHNGMATNYTKGLEPKMNLIAGRSNIVERGLGQVDRTPSEYFMKANILEKVTYPTGGHTSFKYEANRYFDEETKSSKIIGGLRISEMKIFDPSSNNTIVKTYKYGTDESGNGNIIYKPSADDFINESYNWEVYNDGNTESIMNVRKRSIATHSDMDSYINQNTLIWYDQVTEYTNGGKTVYYFDYIPDKLTTSFIFSDLSNKQYVRDYYSYISSQPDLIKQIIFKKESNEFEPIREIINKYDLIENLPPIRGLIVKPYTHAPYGLQWYNHIENDDEWYLKLYRGQEFLSIWNMYAFADYYIHRGIKQLTSTTETDYTDKGLISKTTTYSYDPQFPYNLKSQSTVVDKNTIFSNKFYYPYNELNINKTMLDMLIENNRYTSIVQKEAYKNDKILTTDQIFYKKFNSNIIKPHEAYQMNHDNKNNTFDKQISFDLYDSRGNILQYTARDGVVVSFVWGYGQQYPVAKIVNATYEDVKKALGKSDNDLSYLQNYTDAQLKSELEKLRNQLDKAHVYTYTYKPLVGMVSETDPNGIITEYSYDDFGRLINVVDKDKNILKQFEYHYKNQ